MPMLVEEPALDLTTAAAAAEFENAGTGMKEGSNVTTGIDTMNSTEEMITMSDQEVIDILTDMEKEAANRVNESIAATVENVTESAADIPEKRN